MSVFAQTPPSLPDGDKCIVVSKGEKIEDTTPDDMDDLDPESWYSGLWRWLWGRFKKTDYEIGIKRPSRDINEFGKKKTKGYVKKQSFIGTRSTSYKNQECLKGEVVKKTLLEEKGYENKDIAKICFDLGGDIYRCDDDDIKTIKDLGNYLVNQGKPFYCDENNKLIEIEQNIKDIINNDTELDPIIPFELDCYQKIYQEFYISSTGTKDADEEENIKKVIKNSLFSKDQDNNKSNTENQDQLQDNFIPYKQQNQKTDTSGLYGLRPYKEQ